MVPYISWALTIGAIVFFVFQFVRPKGTRAHIVRGILIPILVILVIMLNTISVTRVRNLEWDQAFMLHFLLGSGCLLSLLVTTISGALIRFRKRLKVFHFTAAILTATFLVTSLLFAVVTRLAR